MQNGAAHNAAAGYKSGLAMALRRLTLCMTFMTIIKTNTIKQ